MFSFLRHHHTEAHKTPPIWKETKQNHGGTESTETGFTQMKHWPICVHLRNLWIIRFLSSPCPPCLRGLSLDSTVIAPGIDRRRLFLRGEPVLPGFDVEV